MNVTVKIGCVLLALGVVLRVAEEFAWPPLKAMPINDPMTLPLLTALAICVFSVPVLLLLGAVLVFVGAVSKPKRP